MKAGGCQLNPALLVVLFFKLCFYGSSNSSELQVCELCNGTVLSPSPVGRFCSLSAGRVKGRCCLKNGTTGDKESIIGLDLSNCSLAQVENLQEASNATMIDLSLNPFVNISEVTFQGFIELNYLILPVNVLCPGGATSWKKIEEKEGNRICQGQNSMCNQTGQMSRDCPENSQCAPFGPGLSECSCGDNYHGYKCLREGEFPVLQVFAPLGASTVVISFVLWITQRRNAKPL
ncbi:all-trans retinoic acid-induced differentiation factor [Eucyclogobius newberryi]|uniref:all-trans retinoic acid-induced differentiation factor n=1 Tax=Eucyclogobius newberryi TaxID=166745 RepID=UPI003B5B1266